MSNSNVQYHNSIKAQIKTFKLSGERIELGERAYSLTSGFIADMSNWKVSLIKDSTLANISIFQGVSKDSLVIELEHSDKYVTADHLRDVYAVVITENQLEYVVVKSWYQKGGMELDTFTLPTTSSFGYFSATTCLNILLACKISIKASTKINEQKKQAILKLIEVDHAFVLGFIQRIPASPHERQAQWLHYEIQRVTAALYTNSRYYWSLLVDHKPSDYDLQALNR